MAILPVSPGSAPKTRPQITPMSIHKRILGSNSVTNAFAIFCIMFRQYPLLSEQQPVGQMQVQLNYEQPIHKRQKPQ